MKWNCKTLIYGNSGIWLKEESNGTIRDFNRGLPNGADHRSIRGVVSMPNGFLYAISQYNLYCLNECGAWMKIDLPNDEHERLSDITQKNDSLIITGRSHIYLSHVPYHTFQKITLKKGGNDKGKVSLFRTIWLLHGGGLFGIVGKLFVDLVGLILLFLSISGIYYSFVPRPHSSFGARIKSWLIKWHNQIGWASIFFLLLLTITGWMLRPPALIAIASAKIPPIPFSAMDSDNPWNDCLRSLRYDDDKEDWLLCTSDGFYSLRHLSDTPQKEQVQPPVSVMGINVEQKDSRHKWLIGSFSGLYVWGQTPRGSYRLLHPPRTPAYKQNAYQQSPYIRILVRHKWRRTCRGLQQRLSSSCHAQYHGNIAHVATQCLHRSSHRAHLYILG
jgi:iron-regulated transmembrane protein